VAPGAHLRGRARKPAECPLRPRSARGEPALDTGRVLARANRTEESVRLLELALAQLELTERAGEGCPLEMNEGLLGSRPDLERADRSLLDRLLDRRKLGQAVRIPERSR
jgi:hypothetical protein